jgi:hypothetical protein
MGLLHALERLVLGITGKPGLWTALAAAVNTVPELERLDYAELETATVAADPAFDQKV